MESNATHKAQSQLETPVLLFDCELSDGRQERWSTHELNWGDLAYTARVLQSGSFILGAWSIEGGSGNSKLQLVLANTDAYGNQVENAIGWKHAKLMVRFCFANLETGQVTTEPEVLFSGVANPPDEITESRIKLSFNNRLNLEKLTLPTVRIQPRCPWAFPENSSQREEAATGGDRGVYSPFYACGYSPDQPEGRGNLNGVQPFQRCERTKSDCQARGMFSSDSNGRVTARFGGFQFLPPTIQVRAHGEKQTRIAEGSPGTAKTGDLAPLLYGTSWIEPKTIFGRSDGNYLHLEVLLGSGPIEGVRKVLADGKEIPQGISGGDYSSTGWWNLITHGERQGGFNASFLDGGGQPLGDPHGSTSILAVALPQKEYGGGQPKLQVLSDGLKLGRVGVGGEIQPPRFSSNPAWVILDVLRRAGWRLSELNLSSFATAASYFDELVVATDGQGREVQVPRASVGLALESGRSISDLLRGIQANAGCLIYLDGNGQLAIRLEGPLAVVHPVKPAHSNAQSAIFGGWPAYDFGDGGNGSEGIVVDESGRSRLRLWSKTTSQCPNRYQIEFQDSMADFRQSGLSMTDIDELAATGQEVSSTHPALGVVSSVHAQQILRLALHKGQRGNQYVEFESSVQAIGLRPGDIISLTYSRWGVDRKLFRVLTIEPFQNFERVRICAQYHEDGWYAQQSGTAGTPPMQTGWKAKLPRPIAGAILSAEGREEYAIEEEVAAGSAGRTTIRLRLGFTAPKRFLGAGAGIPVVSAGEIRLAGVGTLPAGTWFYAFSTIAGPEMESGLSLTQSVTIPTGVVGASVRFAWIHTASQAIAIRVYRGRDPQRLRRVAEIPAPASSFEDSGLPPSLLAPADPAYYETRFLWRRETFSECQVDGISGKTILASELQADEGSLRGMIVRISSGAGEGQELPIKANVPGALETSGAWVISPDVTSRIVICEPYWRAGATAQEDEAVIELENRPGATVHVIGVSVNAAGEESDRGLAPFNRVRLNGDTTQSSDFDVPPAPGFAIVASDNGRMTLCNLGVPSLENTRSVHSGTLRAHFLEETDLRVGLLLLGIAEESTELRLSGLQELSPGAVVQIQDELIQLVTELEPGRWEVRRGALESIPAAHKAGADVLLTRFEEHSVPLTGDIFGSPAAALLAASWPFANRLLVAAEFYLTNAFGSGVPSRFCYTMLAEGGMRFPEGQGYSIQMPGVLHVRSAIAPGVPITRERLVQSIEAILGQSPAGGSTRLRVRLDDSEVGQVEFGAGETRASVTELIPRSLLKPGHLLYVDVLSVPTSLNSWPGGDLSVMVHT